MTGIRNAIAALLAAALLMAGNVFAAANVQSLRGDVRAGKAQLSVNDRVTSGATITTGVGAQAVLRFDDGQQVVIGENTLFRITDYRYRADAEPTADRAIFDLLRGALRMISGAIVAKNRDNFQLRIPQATIGIRGTDFMVVLVNPAFTSVLNGAVSVANSGGTAVFGAGAFGSVASANALAVSIPASALPAAASSAFSSLGAAAGVAAGGMAAGAPPAVAAGGVTAAGVGTAAAVAAAIAVGASIMESNDNDSTTQHSP
jgi:hypothetical protein